MSGQRYTPEFKDEAVKLITERGYSFTDVGLCCTNLASKAYSAI